VIPFFFKNTSAIVIAYDITMRETFQRVAFWLQFARTHADAEIEFFLVGNKSDLESIRSVSLDDGQDFANQNGFAGFVETSAKTGEAVQTLFAMLVGAPAQKLMRVSLEGDEERKKCC
jgi:GTPase SAR1 family protein